MKGFYKAHFEMYLILHNILMLEKKVSFVNVKNFQDKVFLGSVFTVLMSIVACLFLWMTIHFRWLGFIGPKSEIET